MSRSDRANTGCGLLSIGYRISLACHRETYVRHFGYLLEKKVQVVTETRMLVDDRYYRVEHVQHRGMVVRDAFMLDVEAGAIAVKAQVV